MKRLLLILAACSFLGIAAPVYADTTYTNVKVHDVGVKDRDAPEVDRVLVRIGEHDGGFGTFTACDDDELHILLDTDFAGNYGTTRTAEWPTADR